jgi:hypothetical protein
MLFCLDPLVILLMPFGILLRPFGYSVKALWLFCLDPLAILLKSSGILLRPFGYYYHGNAVKLKKSIRLPISPGITMAIL